MHIEKTIERQTLFLHLSGELDLKTANNLKLSIDKEIERRNIKTVILNFQNVQFIDSSGLGVIIGRYKKIIALGGKLKISAVPPHILKIMELSGLPKIINFYADDQSALEEGRGA